MKEVYNMFVVLLILSVITISVISVSADDLNSSNSTDNSTNSTNVTKNLTKNAGIQPMSLSTSISVTPKTADFGNLTADGTEHNITNAATVQVNATNFIWGGGGTLSVRASGDFINGTNSIPLSNFKYECPGNVSKTSFTTDDSPIDQYAPPFIGTIRNTYHINYYLTVPTNTYPGTYSTTIIYTAT